MSQQEKNQLFSEHRLDSDWIWRLNMYLEEICLPKNALPQKGFNLNCIQKFANNAQMGLNPTKESKIVI